MKKEINSLKLDLKLSFSKAKEHINMLGSQITDLKQEIEALKTLINSQKPIEIDLPPPPPETNSIGNKGVYSFIHSFNHSPSIHSPNTKELLSRITKQELLVLLTIAQLEEELTNITYEEISNKLKLSQGCIRGYLTSLIRKGAPIYKEKYNNKITLIKTTTNFRSIDRQTLIDAFYRVDPYQKKLLD